MSRKRSADESIAALYTAAIDPEQWDVALKALTALADARAANCFVHDAPNLGVLGTSTGEINGWPSGAASERFLGARTRYFEAVRCATAELVTQGIAAAATDLASDYAEAYLELIADLTRRAEVTAKSDSQRAFSDLRKVLSLDSVLLAIVDYRGRRRDAVLVAPTHPLRALWFATWAKLGERWVAAKQFGSIGELPLGAAMFGPPLTTPKRIDSEASLLRKEFPAQTGILSARLYVTALGSYRFFLNGHRVGDDVLTPGFTDFRKRARLHVEALNHATANIAPEQLRMHVCWGNYEGPHHCDVPLSDIVDIVFMARPCAISFEAANPRHAHEWTLFETVKLPAGKVLIPGVIESKSNFIEHPELIAQRIGRYAKLVGRENVIAGSDCGYGTWVGQAAVDPDVVFAKLAAMAEGARIASKQFWN